MKQLLEQIKAVIIQPDHWIQHHEAKDIHDNLVCGRTLGADRFCLVGETIKVVTTPYNFTNVIKFLNKTVNEHTEYTSLTRFNDNSAHAEVIAFLDKAIADAPSESVI